MSRSVVNLGRDCSRIARSVSLSCPVSESGPARSAGMGNQPRRSKGRLAQDRGFRSRVWACGRSGFSRAVTQRSLPARPKASALRPDPEFLLSTGRLRLRLRSASPSRCTGSRCGSCWRAPLRHEPANSDWRANWMIEASRISASSATRMRLVPGLMVGAPCGRGRSGHRRRSARGSAGRLDGEGDDAARCAGRARRRPSGGRARSCTSRRSRRARRAPTGLASAKVCTQRARRAGLRSPAASETVTSSGSPTLGARRVELLGRDVELAVAVVVDPQDLAGDLAVAVVVRAAARARA